MTEPHINTGNENKPKQTLTTEIMRATKRVHIYALKSRNTEAPDGSSKFEVDEMITFAVKFNLFAEHAKDQSQRSGFNSDDWRRRPRASSAEMNLIAEEARFRKSENQPKQLNFRDRNRFRGSSKSNNSEN